MPATSRQEAAQHRLGELLAELTDILGPAQDGEADFDALDGPRGQLLLAEWVLVGCWVDDVGEAFTAITPSTGMLSHHGVGLMQMAIADQLHGEGP
jgi:hypothetical protein